MYRSGSWGGVNESDEDERLAVLQAQQDNAYTQIEVVRVSEEARGRSSSGQTEVRIRMSELFWEAFTLVE